MKKSKRGPTWKEINSLKNVSSEKQVKENNRIKKILNGFGWKHRDHWNIVENGYTIDFIKDRLDLQYPRLHFSWHYETEFSDAFMVGEMHGFYNYGNPTDAKSIPVGTYEIRNIFMHNIGFLPVMEERMVTALVNQTVLE